MCNFLDLVGNYILFCLEECVLIVVVVVLCLDGFEFGYCKKSFIMFECYVKIYLMIFELCLLFLYFIIWC